MQQQPTQPTDLENQARQIASAPSKKDGQLAEERSMARRVGTIIAASLPACKWQGKDPKKPEPCVELVFIAASIFCEKHHKEALFHDDTGKNIKGMYPDWNKDLQIVPAVPVNSTVQPIDQFKKTPQTLFEKINAAGGGRFKNAYVSNLRAAKNVTKCEGCGETKIEVLTDTSLLLCDGCYHLGLHVTEEINEATDEPYGVMGWATATKLQQLRSRRDGARDPEAEVPPPADVGRQAATRRRSSHSPGEHRRGSKATRTETRANPNSAAITSAIIAAITAATTDEANDNIADGMEVEDMHAGEVSPPPSSPTSQATKALGALNVGSIVDT